MLEINAIKIINNIYSYCLYERGVCSQSQCYLLKVRFLKNKGIYDDKFD